MPFGSTNEKIPVQEQQVKAPARKKNIDRNVTVVGLLLIIFGIVLLFLKPDQNWVPLLGGTLIIIGLFLLAHELGGGGEERDARTVIPRHAEGAGLGGPRGKF